MTPKSETPRLDTLMLGEPLPLPEEVPPPPERLSVYPHIAIELRGEGSIMAYVHGDESELRKLLPLIEALADRIRETIEHEPED
jgi:hypothetical protein